VFFALASCFVLQEVLSDIVPVTESVLHDALH
jgi:hypothetical protein